jgi:hypothetical protein
VAPSCHGLVAASLFPLRRKIPHSHSCAGYSQVLSLAPRRASVLSCPLLSSPVPSGLGPGDAHESGPAGELEPHLRVDVSEHWQHLVVAAADQACQWIANTEPLRARRATEHVLGDGRCLGLSTADQRLVCTSPCVTPGLSSLRPLVCFQGSESGFRVSGALASRTASGSRPQRD